MQTTKSNCDKSVQTPEEMQDVLSKKAGESDSSRVNQEDRSIQTVLEEAGATRCWTVKMVKKKTLICIYGDSMVKETLYHVKCRMESSGCINMSGAQVMNIRKKIEEEAPGMKDRLMIAQGDGNGLQYVGEDDMLKEVVKSLKTVEGQGMSLAVVGIIKRPREDPSMKNCGRDQQEGTQGADKAEAGVDARE